MRDMQGNPYYGTAEHLEQGNEADQRFALIEATLALAFEQRTANLIAFADLEIRSNGEVPQSLRLQIGGRLGLA